MFFWENKKFGEEDNMSVWLWTVAVFGVGCLLSYLLTRKETKKQHPVIYPRNKPSKITVYVCLNLFSIYALFCADVGNKLDEEY